eukprot:CAMPEP_0184742240 /NCGR_PEP_ID=MMETSP0315-20130426/5233_1 /TAXON_ID=101924 /ORGANISM="Rhodosorus marinus, Strain UTEX LB 2760" /LENGTH=677 /DNA_ID=CAMNT_0027212991 /DNA_START=189 /DNA_END=2222 /DNA_ORIENTATION=-
MGFASTRKVRVLIGFVVGSSGVVGIAVMRKVLKKMLREQKKLAGGGTGDVSKRNPKKDTPKIDGQFADRLKEILQICVPSIGSREGLIILAQSLCLLFRTLLTDLMAKVEGQCAESVTTMNWAGFGRALVKFAIISAPASIVNAALKMFQALMGLSFRWRLSHFLNTKYMTNRAYYRANVLSGLTNADQRITEDVEKFCTVFAELFSYTFKPILDIIIFTRSISKVIGWRGQATLYGYFIICSMFLRGISPPLGLMTAQVCTHSITRQQVRNRATTCISFFHYLVYEKESSLSGNLRTAHARVKANAEEIAFNDPPGGDAERRVIGLLAEETSQTYDAFLFPEICPGLCRRYEPASSVSRMLWLTFFLNHWAGYFVKYTASIVGLGIFALPFYLDPIRKGGKNKKILQLSGHTARVYELLEQIRQMSSRQTTPFANKGGAASNGDNGASLELALPEPKQLDGPFIAFENVTIHTPDKTLLVKGLTFSVMKGKSMIVLGPNGSGKSSLFRTLAELWPLEPGSVTRPRREHIYFLSQKPYIYDGTLREQLLYPWLLRNARDEELKDCLEKVGIGYLLERYGWNASERWDSLLSGGERQRLAMARLLYHKPDFAVLDECTSAVSADGERELYEVCAQSGITMFSIAHRPAVKKYHHAAIEFDGNQSWKYVTLNSDGECAE